MGKGLITYIQDKHAGFIQDFLSGRGKARVCSIPKLGGVWWHAPQEILKFTTSETASGGFSDHVITSLKNPIGTLD